MTTPNDNATVFASSSFSKQESRNSGRTTSLSPQPQRQLLPSLTTNMSASAPVSPISSSNGRISRITKTPVSKHSTTLRTSSATAAAAFMLRSLFTRRKVLVCVTLVMTFSLLLYCKDPYGLLNGTELEVSESQPVTSSSKNSPNSLNLAAQKQDDTNTYSIFERWRNQKKFLPNKLTHPFMKDQFGTEPEIDAMIKDFDSSATREKVIVQEKKARGSKSFLYNGSVQSRKSKKITTILPEPAEGEIGSHETWKSEVEKIEDNSAWKAAAAYAKGSDGETGRDAKSIAGIVGYAVSKEVPILRMDNLNYHAPPTHPSYSHILAALSKSDRKLLEKLRLEYLNSSAMEDPTCGNWQKNYQRFHRATFRNQTAPVRTIMYLCRRTINCGGLADRLLGITSTFVYSLLDDRAFLARWESPILLEALFDSPIVDWKLGFRPGDIERDLAFEEERGREFNWIHAKAPHVDGLFIRNDVSWSERFPEDHLTFFTNRGIAIRLFNSEVYAPRLKEMGLTRENIFGCVLDYLFKPKPAINTLISQFVGLFKLPSVFSVGIQIRTGDASMSDPNSDRAGLSLYDQFFTCADQLVDAYAKPGQIAVFYLVTDSTHLREEAAKRYADEIPEEHRGSVMNLKSGSSHHRRFLLVTGVPIAHTHRSANVEGAAGSVIENWALAATNYRVISLGGYGKIAAFHSRAPNTTIVLNPAGNVHVQHLHSRPVKHCGAPDVFTPFTEMASAWSLG